MSVAGTHWILSDHFLVDKRMICCLPTVHARYALALQRHRSRCAEAGATVTTKDMSERGLRGTRQTVGYRQSRYALVVDSLATWLTWLVTVAKL